MKLFLYRFKFVLRYTVISAFLMWVINAIRPGEEPVPNILLFAAIYGLFVGIYREFVNISWLDDKPFIVRVFIGLLVLQVLVIISVFSFRGAVIALNIQTISISKPIGQFIFTPEFLQLYFKVLFFSLLLLLFIEVEFLLGHRFLTNYLLGRYANPVKEHRIFMFMDLKDSTKLAEELGDDKFYHLLNDCYKLLKKPVLLSKAEIIKYIGDEVVLTWTFKDGVSFNNCIEFFLDYNEALDNKAKYFIKKYKTMPHFKAGLHEGEVVTAYLGDIKKQLDFSGDIMNTTARIQSVCNDYNANFLVSRELFDKLQNTRIYLTEEINRVPLKGKSEPIDLVKVMV